MRINQPFVILSAEQPDLSDDLNRARHNWLRDKISRYEPIECEGCYKGARERSLLVITPGGDDGELYGELHSLARVFARESILYVDANGVAWLDYIDRNQPNDSLGHFTEVAKEYALECAAYTNVVGRYFVASGQ